MTQDPYSLGAAFDGRLRDRDLPEGGADVRLLLGPEGIEVHVPDREPLLLSWRGMRVRRDDGGAWQCTNHGHTVSCADPDFPRALETAGGNEMVDILARLSGERATSSRAHRVACLLTLVLTGVLGWGGMLAVRGCFQAVSESIPYEQDEALGRLAQDAMDPGGPEVDDPRVVEAVEAIVRRLAPHRSLREATFQVRVIDSEVVNAYALPGGYVTVFTGLLREAESPEEVAGVLAHEMAHVTLRHGKDRVLNQIGMQSLILILGGGDADLLLSVFSLGGESWYAREQEAAADEEGVRMLVAAGVDPEGMAGFFDRLADEQGDISSLVQWTSSHPESAARAAEIRGAKQVHLDRLPEDRRDFTPLDVDWEGLRAALEE